MSRWFSLKPALTLKGRTFARDFFMAGTYVIVTGAIVSLATAVTASSSSASTSASCSWISTAPVAATHEEQES